MGFKTTTGPSLLGLKAIRKPRLTLPDSNTDTKPPMIEIKTEPNPIGHDVNTFESNHKLSKSQKQVLLVPEANYRNRT